jgi:dUTPase
MKTVDLKIRFQFLQNHCALPMNKSSARTKYNISVQLGLIDVGYHDYVKAVLQNMDNKPTTLYAGTAVAQLLLLPAHIPYFQDEWPESKSTRGSFGSTGQNFKMKNSTNYIQMLQNVEYLRNTDSDRNNTIPFDLIQES